MAARAHGSPVFGFGHLAIRGLRVRDLVSTRCIGMYSLDVVLREVDSRLGLAGRRKMVN